DRSNTGVHAVARAAGPVAARAARGDGHPQPPPRRGGRRRQAARRRAHRAVLPAVDGIGRGLPALELPHHRRGVRPSRLLRGAGHRQRGDRLHPAGLLPPRRAARRLV
ncbi:MAG: hypothetical protein AVDCRST_MAG40-95, partial [uncultured Gemmatimonadaceae bacterium]